MILLLLLKYKNSQLSEQIIEQVTEGVSQWSSLADEYGVPKDINQAIEKTLLLDLK